MTSQLFAQLIMADALLTNSVLCQIFFQKMRLCSRLLIELQTDGIVIILLNILYLDQAEVFGAITSASGNC